MFWKIRIHASASAACLALGLFLFTNLAEGEVWDRYPAVREGGVIIDFAYNSATAGDLYAVAMENGLWHKTYNSGWPAQWNEHLPGR